MPRYRNTSKGPLQVAGKTVQPGDTFEASEQEVSEHLKAGSVQLADGGGGGGGGAQKTRASGTSQESGSTPERPREPYKAPK